MPLDPPTLGEVLRRFDEVARRLETVAIKLDTVEEKVSKTYVRQDVHRAERQAMESNISDIRADVAATEAKSAERHDKVNERIDRIEKAQKEDVDKRRQMVMALVGMAITLVLGLAALIVNIVQR